MASLPGSDFGGLSEGGFDDKGSDASGPVAEQISFDLSKPCTCALCQKTSVSESPLTSSHLHDKHGSRRPWSSYRKVFDKASGVTYRVPQSKLCSLCRNVWKLLGFSHKYGNIAKYVKMIAEKRVDHAVFLASLDEWIKKHNANPNKHRLRNADDKDSVRDAKEKLLTKDEHGCEFEAPASHAAASPCLFVDICELGGDVADCAAHGQKCPVPQVDLLVLGTSCKDMSRANPCQHKDSAVLSQQVSRGGSAQTFQGMLSYLQSKCPPLVLFENVDAMDDSKGTDMNNMDIFLAETSARGYESQVCMTDAAEFGCSARRRRIYVLLVRTAVNPLLDFTARPLTAAFATFRALLLGCLRGGPCVTQILFQESSEPVQLELGLRLDKRAKQREKDAEKKQGAPAPPQSWVEQHMQFAQNHRVRWGQAVPAKLAANQWYQTLGDREQDALSLLQQCTPYIVFRDLSQSIVRGNSNTWRQDSSKHVMSTVLPRMVLWCEAQNRLVLGREALLMQGFPVQPFLQILAARMETMPLAQQWHPSEALMMDLAGNAMALPVVLAMVQCALAALNWKDRTLSGQAVQLALSQTEDSCWNVC